MLVKRWPPATATGIRRPPVVPSPTAPTSLSPQHHASPVLVRPQLCPPSKYPPTVTCCRLTPCTLSGRKLSRFVPSPNAPFRFPPQQNAVPSAVAPQVWLPCPAARVTNSTCPETGSGTACTTKSRAPLPSCP